jgi:hypothetical protein
MADLTTGPANEEASEVLNAVANVLAKHRCGIVNKNGRTILVKIEGAGSLRALADIAEVSPYNMEFRRYPTQPKGTPQ